jgi:hypothetical protein
MAAKSKTELLAVSEKEFSKLSGVLDKVPADFALVADDDGISIKDIVGHRARWLTMFAGWVADGRAGREVQTPASGYKWNQLPAFNAELRKTQSSLGWDAARSFLRDEHKRFLAFLESETDEKLYGPSNVSWTNKWTIGRWAEAAGPSHYRSATKFIRNSLRQRG